MRWDKQNIVIDGRVRVRMPYTDDFFEAAVQGVLDAELQHLKKVVCWCAPPHTLTPRRSTARA